MDAESALDIDLGGPPIWGGVEPARPQDGKTANLEILPARICWVTCKSGEL